MVDIITTIDFFFLNLIHSLVVNDTLTPFMKLFSRMGNAGTVWIIIGVILVINKKTRKAGIIYLLTLLCEYLINDHVIKTAVCRARPFVQNTTVTLLINAPTDYSFPSGHTASSFTCATYLYRYRKYLGVPAYVLACLIAFSRLYLYVHFPSDVLVGALLGILIGTIGSFFCRQFGDCSFRGNKSRRRGKRHHRRRRGYDDDELEEEYED